MRSRTQGPELMAMASDSCPRGPSPARSAASRPSPAPARALRLQIPAFITTLAVVWATIASVTEAQSPSQCANIVRGGVRVSSGAHGTLAGTKVSATWFESPGDDQPRRRTVETVTDSEGRFALCGVPEPRVVVLRVLTPIGHVEPYRLVTAEGSVREPIALTIDPSRRPTASIVGKIVRLDSSRRIPVRDATVAIEAIGLLARTDSAGRFALRGIPPGTHRVVARHLGSEPVAEAIVLAPNDEVEWEAPLFRLTALSQVTISAKPLDPALLEFEEHRRIGLGKFVTREELAKLEGFQVAQVVQRLTAVRLMGNASQAYVNSRRFVPPPRSTGECLRNEPVPGSQFYVPTRAERSRGIQCACYAHVYVDGVLMNPGMPADPFDVNQIPVALIESIEWYSSPAQLPVKYARLNSSCGVLVIHRRRDPG